MPSAAIRALGAGHPTRCMLTAAHGPRQREAGEPTEAEDTYRPVQSSGSTSFFVKTMATFACTRPVRFTRPRRWIIESSVARSMTAWSASRSTPTSPAEVITRKTEGVLFSRSRLGRKCCHTAPAANSVRSLPRSVPVSRATRSAPPVPRLWASFLAIFPASLTVWVNTAIAPVRCLAASSQIRVIQIGGLLNRLAKTSRDVNRFGDVPADERAIKAPLPPIRAVPDDLPEVRNCGLVISPRVSHSSPHSAKPRFPACPAAVNWALQVRFSTSIEETTATPRTLAPFSSNELAEQIDCHINLASLI